MSSPIRPIFTPTPLNQTPVSMEQLWNSRIVYFIVGLAVGSIATYFINKIWSPRETEAKKPPLSGRATTRPGDSPPIPSEAPNTDVSQKPQDPRIPSPQWTATPTIPVYLPHIQQVEQEFSDNFEKVFGKKCCIDGFYLKLPAMIDLIIRNSSQSENFNLPDFFRNDEAFIYLYLKSKERTSRIEDEAQRVAHDHLKWLLIKDALNTQERVGEKNGIPTPKLPPFLEFSSLAEMEKAAVQIDLWKVTHAEKLRSIQTLDLRELGLISVPDFVGEMSSLKTLHLGENQLFAIPLSLALLPKECTVTIDKQLDISSFNEEVRRIRLTHPHLGPRIIMATLK